MGISIAIVSCSASVFKRRSTQHSVFASVAFIIVSVYTDPYSQPCSHSQLHLAGLHLQHLLGTTSLCWALAYQANTSVQGGLVAQPSGGSWGRPGSPGLRPGTAGSYRGGEAPPSPTKLATLQQTSFNKANSGALSEVSCSCKCCGNNVLGVTYSSCLLLGAVATVPSCA